LPEIGIVIYDVAVARSMRAQMALPGFTTSAIRANIRSGRRSEA
jgi:hypothetical protein